MQPVMIYALAGAALFVMGVAGLILQTHLLRKIVAFNVMGSGTLLILVSLGQRGFRPDRVRLGLVLTGLVVTVAATALALALARRLFYLTGQMRLPEKMPDD